MPEQTDQPRPLSEYISNVICYDAPVPTFTDKSALESWLNMAKDLEQDKERIRELENERRWIPVTENCQPERNSTAIYWHKGIDEDNPIRTGFPAVADEWRWEDHGKRATHFLKYDPPTKP